MEDRKTSSARVRPIHDPTIVGYLTWNFFHREIEAELWCGVPAHLALPPFLLTGAWRFGGHRRRGDDAPPGFDDEAAAVAERFNGFYLFQLVDWAHPLPLS